MLENDGQPVLIDCGSHLHRPEIMAALDQLLAGAAPAFVFLTHSELPHAGNLQQVAQRWPGVRVIVSNVMLPYIEIAPVLPLTQITAATPGTTLDLGNRSLVFLTALLRDQPGSQWIYDPRLGALFTGDAFGYYHQEGQCDRLSDELADGVGVEQFRAYHRNAFRFMRWVQPARLNADLDRLFQSRAVQLICPAHGNAIRSEIPMHVRRLQQALAQAREDIRLEEGVRS
jgi:flavorubredoxin